MPACRKCSRRGWVWDGPSRKECPTCKGSGLREGKTLAQGEGLNPVGPRKLSKMKQVREHKDDYIERYSEAAGQTLYIHGSPVAPCQTCWNMLPKSSSQFSHKRPAGMGGAGDIGGVVDPANGTYSCACCHGFIEQDREAFNEHRASPANMLNGEQVKFSPAVETRWKAWTSKWYHGQQPYTVTLPKYPTPSTGESDANN